MKWWFITAVFWNIFFDDFTCALAGIPEFDLKPFPKDFDDAFWTWKLFRKIDSNILNFSFFIFFAEFWPQFFDSGNCGNSNFEIPKPNVVRKLFSIIFPIKWRGDFLFRISPISPNCFNFLTEFSGMSLSTQIPNLMIGFRILIFDFYNFLNQKIAVKIQQKKKKKNSEYSHFFIFFFNLIWLCTKVFSGKPEIFPI